MPPTGAAWTVAAGRYSATAAAGSTSITTLDLGPDLEASSYIELTATFKVTTAGAIGGVVFDYYAANDFKFVALDIAGQRVVIGHWSPRQGYVVDTSSARRSR